MKMNKLCATAMAVVMAMSAAAVPAFADDAAKSATTNVTATVNGSYSIIVPESVTLSGTGGTGVKSAIISVTLKGDIPEDKAVNVTTTAPVMKSLVLRMSLPQSRRPRHRGIALTFWQIQTPELSPIIPFRPR